MRVGISGSHGFIGRALRARAQALGWEVRALPRKPGVLEIEGCDAVVHLAGETVDGRWTAAKKAEIARSRVDGTKAVVDAMRACAQRPSVFVCASATGFYGDRGDEPLTEASAPGADFLAGVCQRWESEASAAEDLGVRTVMLRTGIVFGRGGALEKMMQPFRFGAGGPLGNGRQFVPWIHIDDIVAMYIFAIQNDALRGPVNAVAPDYANNARLALAIGSAMRRPALMPAPGFALKIALGEFAGSILSSALVIPQKAETAGFTWSHPRLEVALQQVIDPNRDVKGLHTFSASTTLAAPLDEVFAFFSQAKNLDAITPSQLQFKTDAPAGDVRQGLLIRHALTLHGIPMSWKTLIARWAPPYEFVDVQLHGPYALWEHRHSFEATAEGTLVRDHVTYALPLRPFGELAHGFVRRDVQNIFAYRDEALSRRFER